MNSPPLTQPLPVFFHVDVGLSVPKSLSGPSGEQTRTWPHLRVIKLTWDLLTPVFSMRSDSTRLAMDRSGFVARTFVPSTSNVMAVPLTSRLMCVCHEQDARREIQLGSYGGSTPLIQLAFVRSNSVGLVLQAGPDAGKAATLYKLKLGEVTTTSNHLHRQFVLSKPWVWEWFPIR